MEGKVAVVDGPTDGGEVIGDALKLAGVVGDGEIATGGVAKRLAQEEIARILVVDEETREPRPGGAGAAVGAAHEALEVIAQRGHEPQGDVDVDGKRAIVGICRCGTLGDVIQGLVHGEEERDDLPPLGEVSTGGVDLKLDIVADVHGEQGMRRVWCEV